MNIPDKSAQNAEELDQLGRELGIKNFHVTIAPNIKSSKEECIEGALKILREEAKRPITIVRKQNAVTYLEFQPEGYENPIVLPVITKGSRDEANAWSWNGDAEKPTLKPSIKTTHANGTTSHIWLENGVCKYLADSTDGFAGKTLPLPPLKRGN